MNEERFDIVEVTDRRYAVAPVLRFAGDKIAERYEVIEFVGKGSWGSVFKCRDVNLKHLVAIKVLHQHLALESSSEFKRFKQEAAATVRITHPNICRVYEFGYLPDRLPYLVMEFMDGPTLKETLERGGALPADTVACLLQQLADGLSTIHSLGILHRDIKPANIMLSTDLSNAKLVDFGMAKLESTELSVVETGTGCTLGTPCYMSPEQCSAQPVDFRSDLYSLACVVYEMLCGERLFNGNLLDVLNAHVKETLTLDHPNLTANIKLVLYKALAKRPEDRFSGANEFARALAGSIKESRGSWRSKIYLMFRSYFHGVRQVSAQVVVSVVLVTTLIMMALMVTNKALLPLGSASLDDSFKSEMAAGTRHMQSGHPGLAERYFQNAVKLASNFREEDVRNYEALKQLLTATELSGKEPQAVLRLKGRLDVLEHKYPKLTLGEEQTNGQMIEHMGTDAPLTEQSASAIAHLRNNQAQLMLLAHRNEEAEFQVKQARAVEDRFPTTTAQEIATTQSNQAYIDSCSGRMTDAEHNYLKSLESRERLFGKEHPLVAKSYRHLGDFYLRNKRYDDAIGCLTSALVIDRKQADNVDAAWDRNNLGLCYLRSGRFDQSRAFLEQALVERKTLYGDNSLDVARTLFNIGLLDELAKLMPQAQEAYQQALKIFEKELPPGNSETSACILYLGRVYIQAGDTDKASECLKRLKSILGSTDRMVLELSKDLSR